ncbi:MAG TPA: hypothetical protein PJ993_03380 [Candidatus Saccharibacteria bacterium]|nr:hypothetical protein [Candidatus Saccharibacteria bacterium]HMT39944.1 hypothetical protein [Candidatus Saccharibacteria bacterium]
MIQLVAILATLILLGLGVFQLLLILGKPLGEYAWGGQNKVLPNKLRVASATSILLYVIFAWVILAWSGVVVTNASRAWLYTGMWILTVYFATGVLLNLASRSKKERKVMVPITISLTALYLLAIILA